ncbi:MAG: glutathione S-transferase family protein [Halioglobus sp.]
MVTLHGFPASNYYNVVKHVLLYKEIPFEEDIIFSGGDEWRAISPLGKVPALTTQDGRHLSESAVICDYLEEAYPQKPLYPTDAVERAQVRQIMKIAELYLELQSRRLIGFALSNGNASEGLKADVRQTTERGLDALRRLCKFSPWIAGEQFTMADIYVRYVNAVVGSIGSKQLEWDILGEVSGMRDWMTQMQSSEIAKQVDADRLANMPDFQAYFESQFSGK